jgi:hypothetical protein
MPVLDRQLGPVPHLPASLRGLPPRSVPETAPTPLQQHYVLLSVPVLIAGAVAITALEFGTAVGSPLVKLCALIGAPFLLVTGADATLRIWRSAWAWLPVNRGRGLFRLAWVAAALLGLAVLTWGSLVILLA